MKEKPKIFFCEDDDSLGVLLKEFLETKGFNVDLFADGESGMNNYRHGAYDICILDVMMPKKSGFEVARELRQESPEIPIIFLTAKSLKEDVIEGFRIGGDDYITKPFSMEELLLRIEAVIRRINGRKAKTMPFYKLGNYLFDTLNQTLTIGEKVSKLTTKESELLILLCMHSNETLERNYALRTIWVDDNYFNARSMDVYVTKLRKLLKEDSSITIKNVHGRGYKLVTPIGEITEDKIQTV